MSVYSDIPWKNIDGRYQKGNPSRYMDKTASLQNGFTGSELRCYEDCKRQPESIDSKNNEFESKVDGINDKCYCSFRPKSVAQKAADKREPTIVDLNIKQMEFEMMMREYRTIYDDYVNVVAKNTTEDNKTQSNKNMKEFYELEPKVRYVRIRNRRNQYLHIQEIEIYDQDGKNVAINNSNPKLHHYARCQQCSKNVCDSKNYQNMSNTDINDMYSTGGHLHNNSKRSGGPGTVSEVGCCDIDESQKAIRDSSNGAVYGIGKTNVDNKSEQNETTVSASSSIGATQNPNFIIEGMKSDKQRGENSNHTRAEGIQWIELDLKKDVDVRKLVIYNRPDCCHWRLNGANVLLYNNKRELVSDPIRLNSQRVQTHKVDLKGQPEKGRIKQLYLNNTTQKQCFDDCAKDDDCKYVLFKKEWFYNRGWKRRGRCIKYDESADGLIDIENKDRKFAFNAWEKETWEDLNNKDVRSGSECSVNLGKTDSLKACKSMAVNSEEGPFSSVVFVDGNYEDITKANNCYGNSLYGSNNIQEKSGIYSSIPPGGQTGKLDEEELGLLTQLVNLNKRISSHMDKISSTTQSTISKGKNNAISNASMESIYDKNSANSMMKRLENDRKELLKLTNEIQNTSVQNEDIELTNMSKKMKLLILVLIAIVMVAVCVLYLNNSISTYIISIIIISFLSFMYVFNYNYYNTVVIQSLDKTKTFLQRMFSFLGL